MNKKIILSCLVAVSMNTYANEVVTDINTMDKDSFIPCEQITDDIRNSGDGYKCSYIKEENRNINEQDLNSSKEDPYPDLGINNVPTTLIINNKAGYNVYMSAEWTKYDLETNSLVTYYQSTPHISVGFKGKINMGSDVKGATFTAYYQTPVKWHEINDDYYLGPYFFGKDTAKGRYLIANEWVKNDGSEQLVQLDFWATYFNPQWSLVQPSGTSHITSFPNWYENISN
ncbi:hypothetical protein C0W42_19610 [Photobacterium kishitanii]|uniref:hypothetical protein n=1 Tax=Photobacterium kishitanii TaxID=318456 RepID=UPI000D178F52|nr:hypothetical protein [Photobacterium kishitanii]PSU86698.1 hypothetical protein C0W42_19610 [Photobacterium kishitanii]